MSTLQNLVQDHWMHFIDTNIRNAKNMEELVECLEVVRMKDIITRLEIRWDLMANALVEWFNRYMNEKHTYTELITDSMAFFLLVKAFDVLDSNQFKQISRDFTILMIGATAQLYLAIQTELPLATRSEYFIKAKMFLSLLCSLPKSKTSGPVLKQMFTKLQGFTANRKDKKRLNELMRSYHLL